MKDKQKAKLTEASNKLKVAYKISGDRWYSDPDIIDSILNSAFSDIDSVIYQIEDIHKYAEDIGTFLVWRKKIFERRHTTSINKAILLIIIDSIDKKVKTQVENEPIQMYCGESELKSYKDKVDDLLSLLRSPEYVKDTQNVITIIDKVRSFKHLLGNEQVKTMVECAIRFKWLESLESDLHVVDTSFSASDVIVKVLDIKLSSIEQELSRAIYDIV